MKCLVIAEHDNSTLHPATYKTISAAKELQIETHVLVMGYHCQKIAEQISRCETVHQVLVADHEVYEHQLAENCAQLIAAIGKDYTHVLAPATTFGKNVLPRAAALCDVGQLSDVIKIIDADTFMRPVYAGNAMVTVKSLDPIKFITIRTATFPNIGQHSEAAPIEKIDLVFTNKKARFVNQELTKSERPELTNARVIISGGRGLQNGDNFKLLQTIADRLNAAIGASRAAVDAGFVPNDYQVGQTGKIVAPELYIAVGISGAIQHLAGMKDSKIIVAINKDPDAPIFQIADYGLVGDLFKILPEFEQELEKVLGK
jgi:electron transfer flavoprotein alpha subunit